MVGGVTIGCESLIWIWGYDSQMCPGLATQYVLELGYPILADGVLSPDMFCSVYLRLCTNPYYKLLDIDEFISRVLKDKPKAILKNDFVDNIYL